jgi:hypothetical protein
MNRKNVRLIYSSKMPEHIGVQQIQDILAVSRRNNKNNDLTGILCVGSRQFLQCIEGPRDEVNRVYASIMRDPRHSELVLLGYMETDTREFRDWLMGYVPESSIIIDLIARTMGRRSFEPLALSTQSAMDFLRGIKQYVPVA